jgi:hypothetical protein
LNFFFSEFLHGDAARAGPAAGRAARPDAARIAAALVTFLPPARTRWPEQDVVRPHIDGQAVKLIDVLFAIQREMAALLLGGRRIVPRDLADGFRGPFPDAPFEDVRTQREDRVERPRARRMKSEILSARQSRRQYRQVQRGGG